VVFRRQQPGSYHHKRKGNPEECIGQLAENRKRKGGANEGRGTEESHRARSSQVAHGEDEKDQGNSVTEEAQQDAK
jgi:hypothetical protein